MARKRKYPRLWQYLTDLCYEECDNYASVRSWIDYVENEFQAKFNSTVERYAREVWRQWQKERVEELAPEEVEEEEPEEEEEYSFIGTIREFLRRFFEW